MATQFDAIVIGAGISGAAAAYELARHRRVLLLEREARPGYHSTGRSAALYTPNYGNAAVRALVRIGHGFLERPPSGFADHPLLAPRGALTIATFEQAGMLDAVLALSGPGHEIVEISPQRALTLAPILRPAVVARSAYEPGVADIEVAALHQGFLKGFKARSGTLATDAEARRIEQRTGAWRVVVADNEATAPILVNAAGAWADEVAALAGIPPVGLVPKRRTAIIVEPGEQDPRRWPAIDDAGNDHYIKPDGGRLMASPGDATPSPPCDVQPDELDVALLVDWLERTTTLEVARIPHRWAGLRSFVADDSPVMGEDPAAPGFWWLAGQGGYGIMLAAPLARALASLLETGSLPEDFAPAGMTPAALDPRRPALSRESPRLA
jgi:D-arginine dehydrogenase